MKIRQGLEYGVEVISWEIVKEDAEFRQGLAWDLSAVRKLHGFDDVSNGGESVWS